ncbi:hypothetical protein BTJ40_20175 [Microbulbifer sp. A4B17]|uniref:hypothetical protein n=1 Tax=Microbulbifer sp. A4B17 TaxID=359370 RepID=UPI000D52E10B|nr:hypothetical protein [Microbulbifer sp. A4B17]AWF82950.1 hypothetical protein BTJ40_20175 [Microbulbifer sp. A4B17]
MHKWVLLVIVMFSSVSFGENSAANIETVEGANAVASEIAENNLRATTEMNAHLKSQIELLEAKLELSENHQAAVLGTVYWALGGVFVVVSLLLGFGWFANFRIYERDKDILKADLSNTLNSRYGEIEKNMSDWAINIENDLSGKFKELEGKVGSVVKSRVSEGVKSMGNKFDSLERRVFTIEFKILKTKMTEEKSKNMALTSALNLVKLCWQNGSSGEIPDILKFVIKTLDEGGKFTADEIVTFNVILDKFPADYKTLSDKVREKLHASEIF